MYTVDGKRDITSITPCATSARCGMAVHGGFCRNYRLTAGEETQTVTCKIGRMVTILSSPTFWSIRGSLTLPAPMQLASPTTSIGGCSGLESATDGAWWKSTLSCDVETALRRKSMGAVSSIQLTATLATPKQLDAVLQLTDWGEKDEQT